jgi:hypothetical protein
VVADPDIAELISGLVEPVDDGECPQVEVGARESTDVLADLTRGGSGAVQPDVWIPASSLWLRLADSRDITPSFGSGGGVGGGG